MSILNFWKRKEAKAEAETAPAASTISPQLDDVLLTALLNNETITRDKALTLPVVSCAVDLISSTVASMPIKLYHYTKGKVEEVERDRRVNMLNGSTGDVLTGYSMKKAMVEDYLLGKGGYAYIERERNDVRGLYYVKDVYVSAFVNADPIYKVATFQIGDHVYRDWEIIKLLRNTRDGATGRGLTDEVSKALQTAYSTLLYQLNLVQTGGNKKGFVKSQNRLSQEAIDTLKSAWRKFYTNNEENVIVLNSGLDFQEASNNSVEMQLDQSKKTLNDDINRIFHIHDDWDRTFKEAIYPIVKTFEAAINSTLLLESEKKNFFFEFDVKEILRSNIKERYEAYEKALKSGWMTYNEVRQAENMNEIEGLDVVNVGLGAVLYDKNTHQFYTPNTNTTAGGTKQYIDGDGNIQTQTEIQQGDEGGEEDDSEGAGNTNKGEQ